MLIGIAGHRRAGKDTVGIALWLAGFYRVAFADAIRQEVYAAHPLARHAPKDAPLDSLGGRTTRELMLEVGAKRRLEDPMYWVKIARGKIQDHLDKGRDVVVTDVRMPEEVDVLREMGARLLWVERPGVTSNGDVTEQDLSFLCDDTLRNDGAEIDLQLQVIRVIGGQRCGACKGFSADRLLPRYGFCRKAPSQEAMARLQTIVSPCSWPDRFAPCKPDPVQMAVMAV